MSSLSQQRFTPAAEQLQLAPAELLDSISHPDHPSPKAVGDPAATICRQLPEQLALQAGYLILEEEALEIDQDKISVYGFTFQCGSMIADRLRQATRLTLFALTLGDRFDSWIRQLTDDGDPLGAFLADTAGGLLAERVAELLEDEVTDQAAGEGLGATRRFSPGYCNWQLQDQEQLFQLLPENCCGIRLQPSCLMLPLKSISGIIGLGPGVEKQDYACTHCVRVDCHLKQRRD